MKPSIAAIALVLLSAVAQQGHAADRKVEISFQDLLESPEARDAGLDGSVRFYLEGQPHPAVVSRHGEGVSNKRTNGANKTDEVSCRRAALSALLSFQQSAKDRGANAVIDVVSFFKRNTFSSPVNFECTAGNIMSAVTLKGTYATIR